MSSTWNLKQHLYILNQQIQFSTPNALYLQINIGVDWFWQQVELNSKHVEKWGRSRKKKLQNYTRRRKLRSSCIIWIKVRLALSY